jgi:hypothetical protein
MNSKNPIFCFLIKIFIVFLFAFCVIFSYKTFFLHRFAPPQAAVVQYAASLLNESTEVPKGLLLGDSVAATSIQADIFGKGFYSLALFGGSAPEAYVLLRRLAAQKRVPSCIVLSFSYNWAPYIDKSNGHLMKLFLPEFYSLSEFFDLYTLSLKLGVAPSTYFPAWKVPLVWFLSKFWFPPLNFSLIQDSVFNEYLKVKFLFAKEIIEKRQGSLNKMRDNPEPLRIGPEQDFLFKKFQAEPLLDSFLLRIVNLAQENGASVYYFFAPFHPMIRSNQSVGLFLSEYANHLSKLMAEYKNFKLLYVPLSLDENHYNDPTHLNELGANVFSRELLKKVHCSRE